MARHLQRHCNSVQGCVHPTLFRPRGPAEVSQSQDFEVAEYADRLEAVFEVLLLFTPNTLAGEMALVFQLMPYLTTATKYWTNKILDSHVALP